MPTSGSCIYLGREPSSSPQVAFVWSSTSFYTAQCVLQPQNISEVPLSAHSILKRFPENPAILEPPFLLRLPLTELSFRLNPIDYVQYNCQIGGRIFLVVLFHHTCQVSTNFSPPTYFLYL